MSIIEARAGRNQVLAEACKLLLPKIPFFPFFFFF